MNNRYSRFMLQQKLSEGAKATFYEKLATADTKRRLNPCLRAAVIAACILLLIPVTILAVENIFGVVILNRKDQLNVLDQPGVGLDVRFDDIKNRPVTDFSEHLQAISDVRSVYYDSWEEAEEDLGIDLISNGVLDDKETEKICFQAVEENLPQKHCEGIYRGADCQLYYARISAAYLRNCVKFVVSARITAEHPFVADEQLQQYHNTSIVYYEKDNPNVATEQFISKNGIPMTICTVKLEGTSEYSAYFMFNNISYGIRVVGCEGVWDDSTIYTVFRDVLEGFEFSET